MEGGGGKMDRYIVESQHTESDCKKALQDILAAGYITHFEWGCADGDHRGWAIIEAENAKEAMMVVPSSQRAKAAAIRLTKFSREEIEAMHHKEGSETH
jgi:hypothetical protein